MKKNRNFLLNISKIKVLILAIIIGIVMLFAQQNANALGLKDQWTLQYGGAKGDSLATIVKTNDGGYIAVGLTYGDVGQSTSFGKADGWILKVSSEGTMEWSKQYGGTENDYLSSIAQTSDGGYIVAGDTEGGVDGNTSYGDTDGWILKISDNGTTEWSKQYGSSSTDNLESIQVAVDGGYIATGVTLGTIGTATSLGYFDGYVLKISNDGTEQWVKQYGTPSHDSLTSIQSTTDGGYIVSGYTNGKVGSGSSFGTFDGWLLKISSTGAEQWSKQYGTSGEDLLRGVRQTNDGGFVAVGHFSSPFGSNDGWILKTDSSGAQEWSKLYGNSQYEFLSSVEQTNDGGYVAVGKSYQSSQYDGWLLKINDTGTTEWSKFYGTGVSDTFNSVIPLNDESFVVAGATSGSMNGSTNLGLDDGFVMKLNVVYDLEFDLNGGEGNTPLTQSLEKGMLAKKPDSPSKEKFAFVGWNTAQDGNGISWDFSSTVMPASDTILYAQWSELYQLQFDLNGGTGTTPAVQTLIEGAIASEVNQPTKDGYSFKGWNTAQDGSGTNWNFKSTTMPANNVTLYAQWNKLYQLQFDLNGGQGVAPDNQKLNEGKKANKPANPSREGYEFKEWNTKKDGSGQTWNFITDIMPASNMTLYAQWTKNNLPDTGFSNTEFLFSTLLALAGVALVVVNKKRYLKK